MPATEQDPGGCGCPGVSGCAVTIAGNVRGCNSLALPGVSVAAHDSTAGGTTLATATTDAAGNYTLASSAAISGNAIVVVFGKSPRFASASTTLAYNAGIADGTHWHCGATSASVNRTLARAAGYHCWSDCPDPLKDTLTLTDSEYGSAVLTWTSGTTWTGSLMAGYAGSGGGCGGCPATIGNLKIDYAWGTPGAILGVQPTQIGGCPDPAGFNAGGDLNSTLGGIATTCPPSFGWIASGVNGWTSTIVDALYDCSPVTFTVTE